MVETDPVWSVHLALFTIESGWSFRVPDFPLTCQRRLNKVLPNDNVLFFRLWLTSCCAHLSLLRFFSRYILYRKKQIKINDHQIKKVKRLITWKLNSKYNYKMLPLAFNQLDVTFDVFTNFPQNRTRPTSIWTIDFDFARNSKGISGLRDRKSALPFKHRSLPN